MSRNQDRLKECHCSRCGGILYPTPQWAYKRGDKIFCGFPCSDADFKEIEQKKQREKELKLQRSREIERERARERARMIRSGEYLPKNDSPRKRAVLQFTTDGKFVAKHDSVTDAATSVNKSPPSIVACVKNRRETTAGFVWVYADENTVAECDE